MPMKRCGFFDDSQGPSRGKSVRSIQDSKLGRNALLTLFGGLDNLPSSVMRSKPARVNPEVDGAVANRGLYERPVNGTYRSKDERLPKDLRRAFHVSGSGCPSGALSTFPQMIGRSLVLLYTEPGNVVFDPFAGHNSRMELCVRVGRHYVGCDLSREFMVFNRRRAKQLHRELPGIQIELHEGDSRKVPVADASADFTITSPPYYDIEYYGDEPEQLGKADSYRSFLRSLRRVMRENYRVLRPGSFAAWFVNDFRRKGVFHLYHTDTIRLMRSVGFVVHDILIVDLGRTMRDCFTNQVIATKILPKRHEYGLIFRKPE